MSHRTQSTISSVNSAAPPSTSLCFFIAISIFDAFCDSEFFVSGLYCVPNIEFPGYCGVFAMVVSTLASVFDFVSLVVFFWCCFPPMCLLYMSLLLHSQITVLSYLAFLCRITRMTSPIIGYP